MFYLMRKIYLRNHWIKQTSEKMYCLVLINKFLLSIIVIKKKKEFY